MYGNTLANVFMFRLALSQWSETCPLKVVLLPMMILESFWDFVFLTT